MKTLFRKAAGCLAIAFAAVGSAQAATATLAELFKPGGSIQAGDKLFDNWTQNFYDTSFAGKTFNPANILVTSLDDGGLNPGPGLSFSVLNGELSVTGANVYTYIDLQIGFRASVLLPGLAIKDVSLGLGIGDGVLEWRTAPPVNDLGMYVHEDVGTTAGGDDLGTNEVEFSVLDNALTSNLTDTASFAPQSELWVTKNILVWSQNATDTATLSGFEQRFSQTPIPEPASFALVGVALAAAAAARRLRRRETRNTAAAA
jgi:hypothetical protein